MTTQWKPTDEGECHADCPAWKTNNGDCPWAFMHGPMLPEGTIAPDWDTIRPGGPCPVLFLLTLVGRAPTDPKEKPTCANCAYCDEAKGLCRVNGPRSALPAATETDGPSTGHWPLVKPTDWCGKHPRIKALDMRHSMAAGMGSLEQSLARYAEMMFQPPGGR